MCRGSAVKKTKTKKKLKKRSCSLCGSSVDVLLAVCFISAVRVGMAPSLSSWPASLSGQRLLLMPTPGGSRSAALIVPRPASSPHLLRPFTRAPVHNHQPATSPTATQDPAAPLKPLQEHSQVWLLPILTFM